MNDSTYFNARSAEEANHNRSDEEYKRVFHKQLVPDEPFKGHILTIRFFNIESKEYYDTIQLYAPKDVQDLVDANNYKGVHYWIDRIVNVSGYSNRMFAVCTGGYVLQAPYITTVHRVELPSVDVTGSFDEHK